MENNHDGDRTVGRYALMEQIGSGGFGETWRAYDEMLDTDVAIKAFRYPDDADHDRYLREARSMARLSGVEGIAHVRDLIEEGEQLYLVMDYVEGEDLSQLLAREGRLSQGQTLHILEPVSSALEAMHGRGVVHRDVSPDNIRVTPEGRGTLLDFGSVLSASHVGHTITVKPGYAPPEQYGEASAQGPWTDVYALAACAYQCLCGTPPIDSLQRVFHDEIKRPSELGVALPREIEDALMAGLALDGRSRTQTMRELMEGLSGAAGAVAHAEEGLSGAAGAAAHVDETSGTPGAQVRVAGGRAASSSSKGEAAHAPEVKTNARDTAEVHRGESFAKNDGLAKTLPKFELKKLGMLAGALVAVVLAVVLGVTLFGRVGSTDSPTYETISRETISIETASRLANDPEKKSVTFTRCVVPDEALEMLATSETIESITLNACTGFSSLEVLDGMSGLVSLNLSTMEDVDLAALFPKTMHTLEQLRLQTMSIEGGTEALGRFPKLTTLVLSPVEGVDDIGFLESLPKLEASTSLGARLTSCPP